MYLKSDRKSTISVAASPSPIPPLADHHLRRSPVVANPITIVTAHHRRNPPSQTTKGRPPSPSQPHRRQSHHRQTIISVVVANPTTGRPSSPS
ncbi:hypothetical protein TIFTF001_024315 [Ficus carica]|uniref:Uncharacterized protein n=1 Tax=Ficus carica TaxID=3494 RepID=A0AA88DD79_FICCA|nr:hypothetical protein TIFTF001_024315 [Ficus carica]